MKMVRPERFSKEGRGRKQEEISRWKERRSCEEATGFSRKTRG